MTVGNVSSVQFDYDQAATLGADVRGRRRRHDPDDDLRSRSATPSSSRPASKRLQRHRDARVRSGTCSRRPTGTRRGRARAPTPTPRGRSSAAVGRTGPVRSDRSRSTRSPAATTTGDRRGEDRDDHRLGQRCDSRLRGADRRRDPRAPTSVCRPARPTRSAPPTRPGSSARRCRTGPGQISVTGKSPSGGTWPPLVLDPTVADDTDARSRHAVTGCIRLRRRPASVNAGRRFSS